MVDLLKKVRYKLHKKQWAALELILSVGIVIAGFLSGKRGGKTICGAHFALKMIEERPHELGAIFSPTSEQLTHFTLSEFKKVLASYGIMQGTHYVVNINPKDKFGYESKFPSNHYGVWSFWNGAQIYTFSIESFFMGAEFGWAWGDEIQNISKAKLDEVSIRMSGSKNPKMFLTFTPPYNNPEIEKLVYKDNSDEPGEGTLALVVGTTYDNKKNLEPGYLEMLENTLDPLTFQRDVMCRRVVMVGFPWLYAFDRKKHVSEEAKRIDNEMVYVTMDFNNNPFVCLLAHRGVRNGKRFIHYFDEIELTPSMVTGKTFIEAMVEQIWTRTPTQYKNNLYMITGDATGRSQSVMMRVGENIWTELVKTMRVSAGQIRLSASNPLNANARELCNAIFAKYDEVLINPKCKGLIRDCEYVQANPDGTMIKESRSKDDQRADFIDAMKYDLNAFNYDFLRR